jgi:hypothetical protein
MFINTTEELIPNEVDNVVEMEMGIVGGIS